MAGVDGHDGRTRDLIVRRLLEHGPTTAMDLAGEFGLSGAAVRRHLDSLIADGTVTTRDAPRASGRGRGRPARQHLLTEQGRRRAGRGEADVAELAVAALRELSDAAGEDAVRAFARRRVLGLLAQHRDDIGAHADRPERVESLAGALSREGYAASTRATTAGEALCQHHCPVAGVAAEFPQLCEAETEVFAELLGTHVQRLSTIARGDAACTTHVPNPTTTGAPTDVKGRQVV
jgi:predicted ArsR family transcriptional regulator